MGFVCMECAYTARVFIREKLRCLRSGDTIVANDKVVSYVDIDKKTGTCSVFVYGDTETFFTEDEEPDHFCLAGNVDDEIEIIRHLH